MQRGEIAMACVLSVACLAAQAQTTNVTIYGILDTGVEYLNHVGPNSNSLVRMPTLTGSLPSRLGFRGTEDLGGANKAVFTLENGLAVDSGTAQQGGRLFGRQAYVGLTGEWGALTLGRQYTMLFWSILDSDVLGPNIYGSGSLDSYIPNARTDNSIAYRGTFSNITIGATYSFGRDTVNAGPSPAGTNCAGENAADKQACREWSAMLKYDGAKWGLAAAYDRLYGGPGAFAGLTKSDLTDSRATLNGYVKWQDLKLTAGVIRRDNQGSPTARSDLYFVGAVYPVTPLLTIDGELFRLDFKDSPNRSTLFALRGTYSFSKRTSAYLTAGYIGNDGASNLSVSSGATGSNPQAGQTQTGAMIGIRQFF